MTLTRLTLFFKGFAICQFLLLIITVSVAGESYPGSFEETLERHLTAIVSRDLQVILATVAEGDSLTLILPDGSLIKDKAAYADLHEAWFSDPD
ncbi:MAG: hypothetical protein GY906_39845, partial [bacterium]|nr:hypothetical protein [bacterium]